VRGVVLGFRHYPSPLQIGALRRQAECGRRPGLGRIEPLQNDCRPVIARSRDHAPAQKLLADKSFERAERFVASLQAELAEAARCQAIAAGIIGEMVTARQ
jgi:hypothetical protein